MKQYAQLVGRENQTNSYMQIKNKRICAQDKTKNVFIFFRCFFFYCPVTFISKTYFRTEKKYRASL